MQHDFAGKFEMFYNIKKVELIGEWARIILFSGESGRFVQTSYDELLYVGGFMGTKYSY